MKCERKRRGGKRKGREMKGGGCERPFEVEGKGKEKRKEATRSKERKEMWETRCGG